MPSINDANEVQVLGSNANNDEEDLGRSEMLNLGHAEQESRVMILSENIGAHVLTEERKEEDLEPEQSTTGKGGHMGNSLVVEQLFVTADVAH